VPFTSAPVVPRQRAPEVPSPVQPTSTLLRVLTDAMVGDGAPAHRVWLPPLSTSEPLERLPVTGRLRVPVAVVDRPFEQRRDPLWLRLDGAAGHVAIVGAPQSGKSGLVRTLVTALALAHTPAEVTCYCLDFGGGSLSGLSTLPHVGAVVGRAAAEAVRRTVGDIAALLAVREREFGTAGIADVATARARGSLGAYGDVFLVVDGWATLRSDFDDLEPMLVDIATRGLSYGVHVVVTAVRWADVRPALRDLLASRLELRLGDPGDSQIGRKAAVAVPAGSPGRGLTLDSRHFLAAVTSEELIAKIANEWDGPRAPAVRELPLVVPFESLDHDVAGLALPIGLAASDLASVAVDFGSDPHLLIFGEPGSGKSSALRAIAASIVAGYRPEQARLVVVDYRRSMLGEIDGDHLIGYATADGPAVTLLDSVADYMRRRLPGPDVTPVQLRTRSWWTGPECFVLVDDYDLVAAGSNPLVGLLDLLSQAGDVGLHLIIARRSGGAARAMFEPILGRLRELATPGLVLSGDREEGALVGSVRPQSLPPGRCLLVDRRNGGRLVQLAYLAPAEAPV
jgi:S-DNA-T family DNA segregation ATPase FtsK/SpoIIIE